MKQIKIKKILVPAVSLFIICLVITALLAVTNNVTTAIIAQQGALKVKEAR
ncbi:hypothetical protein AGMMS50284_7710 [Clostridia bacterium]|nr:hypothetical protein AGMMS50284_7710 [Clostridia bacterium]